jgi:DNA-binding transcriptional LysR family regulator
MKNQLNSMRVFAQVVEAKSFSAAADSLHMSKSLASRHVSALEKTLAVKLLIRSTRKLSLTEAGAQFYEHCARIVREAELAEQNLTRTQTEPAGLVKVTATPAFAVRHVLPALGEFYRQYPKIRVQISCSNQTLDLGETGFDLGIRVAFEPSPNLVARKLAANRSVLCATPDYVKRHGAPSRVDDLRNHECVLFSPLAPKGIWTFRHNKRKYSVPVSGTLETDEMDAVHAAIAAGLGIGILPTYLASDSLRNGELLPLLRGYQIVPESAIYLVYLPNHTLSSRVRALIDFLVERFRSTPPPWEAGWYES